MRILRPVLVIAAAISLTACATGQQQPYYGNSGYQQQSSYGYQQRGGTDVGCIAGTVVGGVAGAAIGNQIGKGTGKTVMTGVGAAGGALAGQQLSCQPVY